MAYCSKCGKELVKGARFCSNCGKTLSVVKSKNRIQNEPEDIPFAGEVQTKKIKTWFGQELDYNWWTWLWFDYSLKAIIIKFILGIVILPLLFVVIFFVIGLFGGTV